jgi:hypothetical protein
MRSTQQTSENGSNAGANAQYLTEILLDPATEYQTRTSSRCVGATRFDQNAVECDLQILTQSVSHIEHARTAMDSTLSTSTGGAF